MRSSPFVNLASATSVLGVVFLGAAVCVGVGGCRDAAEAPTLRIVITAPAEGALYRAGAQLDFVSSATDADGNAIPDSALVHWIDFHHDTHTHPFEPESPGGTAVVTVPDRGETASNVFFRFHVRASDTEGRVVEATRDVLPHTAVLTLATDPPGLGVTLDGQPTVTPAEIPSVVGLVRAIGVTTVQELGGRRFGFTRWSDGGAVVHELATPEDDTTYTATFVDIGPANIPPSCVLDSPSAPVDVGVATSLTATVSDADGSVTSVAFFDGSTMIGVADTLSPFGLSWTPSTSGTHSLTARCVDDGQKASVSAAVVLDVDGGTGDTAPPTCTLTSPTNHATGLAGALLLSATASDDVGVVGVLFQIDGDDLGVEDTSAPFEATLSATGSLASGQHVFRARARDAAGNVSAWATAVVEFGGDVVLPAGFVLEDPWVSGLTNATAMAFAPDGRLFVCQQGGALRVVSGGALLATPFHTFTVASAGERGLLGIAFDPNFFSNHYVYVYYTVPTAPVHNRVSRLTADGDVMLAGSELVLVDLTSLSTATNHNGGAMHFGPDGKLYVAVGDNANSGNAQSGLNVLGKMLRFNPDGSIPFDNPFYGSFTGKARAIWAMGLRNPFTFAIQPATGRMHINDVGQVTWEEVNVGAVGANYGWPTTEGRFDTSAYPSFTPPLFAYDHGGAPVATTQTFLAGIAVIGATFYTPANATFPVGYAGDYFFGDYTGGWIARMDVDHDDAVNTFALILQPFVDLAVGQDGSLYVLGRSKVMRITHP